MGKSKKIFAVSLSLGAICGLSNTAMAAPHLNKMDINSVVEVQHMIADKTDDLKNISPAGDNEKFIKYNETKILKMFYYGDGSHKSSTITINKESKKTPIKSKPSVKDKKNTIKKDHKSNGKKVKLKSKDSILIDGEYYIITNESKSVTKDKRSSKTVYVNGVRVGSPSSSSISSTNSNEGKKQVTQDDFFTGKSDEWKCKVNSGDAQLKDWVSKIRSRILVQFTGVQDIGGYRAGDPQDHGTGNALDVMVPVSSKLGDEVADWAIMNSQYLNIKYVIWKQHIWLPDDPTVWRGMNDRGSITQNHYDHVHLSFYDGVGVCPTN